MPVLNWTLRRALGAATSLALLGAFGVATWGGGDAAASTSRAGSSVADRELTIAQQQAITTLTEDAATAVPAEYDALGLVADSLWQMLPTGKLAPDLASSATHSSSGLVWTFHLRKGIKFSNGQPVTSTDVKFTYEHEVKQPLEGINYKNITSIATPNSSTVVFTTKTRDVNFLTTASAYNVAIVPKTFDGEKPATFWKKPIGDGAFTVATFQPGVEMVLKKNPLYFNASKVTVKEITLEPVTDENTAALKLEDGEVNAIATIPGSEVDTLEGRPGLTVHQVPNGAAYFLVTNNKLAPLSNLDVRRAISLALDRSDMVKSALLGHGTIAASWLAATALDGYKPPFGKEYSLAKAKALMAKTPYSKGFTLDFPYDSQTPVQVDCAEIIESNLAALHIKVDLDGTSANAASTDLTAHKFGLAFGTIYWNGDPGSVISYYVSTGGFYSQSTNAKAVTRMLTKALTVFNTTARMHDYQAIIKVIADSANNIGLISPDTYMATGGDVAKVVAGSGSVYYQYTTFK